MKVIKCSRVETEGDEIPLLGVVIIYPLRWAVTGVQHVLRKALGCGPKELGHHSSSDSSGRVQVSRWVASTAPLRRLT